MRTYVMGDLHGGNKALRQCLIRSSFDNENDQLIQLGDIADGYPEVYDCVEELLKIKNLISIKGNHDDWFNDFITTDLHPYFWTYGGKGTLISYLNHSGQQGRYFASRTGFKTALQAKDIPQTHKEFFANQKLYYTDQNDRCFLHAGFNRNVSFYDQPERTYYWDRSLWKDALTQRSVKERVEDFKIVTPFNEIYIGHTSIQGAPQQVFNIINMDTGAGHSGRLTIMDVDTKRFWQSDPLPDLYPESFNLTSPPGQHLTNQ